MKKPALITMFLVAGWLSVSVTYGQSFRRDAHTGQPGHAGQQEASASLNQTTDQNSPQDQQREWLRARMLQEFSDIDRRAEIHAKVDQMSAERVDALVKIYQKREQGLEPESQNDARRQSATSQAQRDYLVQQYRNRLAAARGGGRSVGYAPVVTWLPEGASLGASAVVSPDRRYVRMSLQPFFSTVDGVDTFNFHTGQTRHYPSYGQYPSYGRYPSHGRYPSQARAPSFERDPTQFNGSRLYRRTPPQPPVRTYYDGLRTRTSRP